MATNETAIIKAKPSKDNISQPDNIVNNSSMQNSENNTKTKQFSISNNENALTVEESLPYNEYTEQDYRDYGWQEQITY